MQSLIEGFSCDVFISYRQNDNRPSTGSGAGSGWVSTFVDALRTELSTLIKQPVSVYFDTDPREGLLETHVVDKSIERRLRSLVFIPVVSQTYCDPNCFAWKDEFCAFHRLASQDRYGINIDLRGGNVGSRILPIRIHDLEPADERMLKDQLGHPPRFLDFVCRSAGMNRPLRPGEAVTDGGPKYEDQLNKMAIAIKEIVIAAQDRQSMAEAKGRKAQVAASAGKLRRMRAALVAVLAIVFLILYKSEVQPKPFAAELGRAEMYMDEFSRFGDKRYRYNAHEVVRRILLSDSTNEHALFLMAGIMYDSGAIRDVYKQRLYRHYPSGTYTLMSQAGDALENGNRLSALESVNHALEVDAENKYALEMLAIISLLNGDYLGTWTTAQKYQRIHKEGLNDLLSTLFLELGDFEEARNYLRRKRAEKEFSCHDLETLQRIRLCAGEFEKLEIETDSICRVTQCEDCPMWQLRAKMHAGKYSEAHRHVRAAMRLDQKITWRLPAFVLLRIGKTDSARLIAEEELKYDREKLADTTYAQSIPLYSMAAIYAMRGENAESLKYLKQYADHGFEMGSEWYIAHDPLFDEAQKDQEYFGDFMQIIQKAQARKNALREKIRME